MPIKVNATSVHLTQILANLFTVVAAVLAIVTIFQARQSLNISTSAIEHEKESKTIELSLKYDDLMGEAKKDGSWKRLAAVDIASAIYKLRSNDDNWRSSVEGMITDQIEYLQKFGLDCDQYDTAFLTLIRKQVSNVCDTRKN